MAATRRLAGGGTLVVAQQPEELEHPLEGGPIEAEPAGRSVLQVAQMTRTRRAHRPAGDDPPGLDV
jgi:hypothetical protein